MLAWRNTDMDETKKKKKCQNFLDGKNDNAAQRATAQK